MDKYLRPSRFEVDANATGADKQWSHWYKTFSNFLDAIAEHEPDKLVTLTNYVAPNVYEYIAECTTYETAIETLEALYLKPTNEIYARHVLATRRQEAGESLDQYLQVLKRLSKDCNFKSVSAEKNREDFIRDSFINGLQSKGIRQRLLENKTLDLKTAFDQARALEMAQKNSESYYRPNVNLPISASASIESQLPRDNQIQEEPLAPVAAVNTKCFFCGLNRHPRSKCPAKDSVCNSCGKTGHYARVCKSVARSSGPKGTSAAMQYPTLAAVTASSGRNLKAITDVIVNGHQAKALIDSGSSLSCIDPSLVHKLKLSVQPESKEVSMASLEHQSKIEDSCLVKLGIQDQKYNDVHLFIMNKLCTDIILGQDFLKQYKSVEITFGGSEPTLHAYALKAMNVPPPSLFQNLTPDCKPVAIKSRRYTADDSKFIETETKNS